MIYLLIRWMNTSRVKYSSNRDRLFGLFFVCSRIMKEYPILCDKIECYKKERGCNPMKKDRLIVLTDAVLAIIMTILVLELEKPTTPSLEAFWDLRQNFFACFLSFFWLGSLWMALNTLWEKVEKISSEIIWWNLFLLLERQEFSLENFMPSKIPV